MRQYETVEFSFQGKAPSGSEAQVELTVVFTHENNKKEVRGFYAGNGTYKVRFLPEEAGEYTYVISGPVTDEGRFTVKPYDPSVSRGIVRAKGTHFAYENGNWFYPFGTTVYALAHQTDELMNETIESIQNSPFNKVRMCVFPKDYHYNKNEPQYYAFARREDGSWDVDHPDFRFWDAFEDKIRKLADIGVQVDLILFHPYDRWGLSTMPQRDNLVYLDYLIRRFAAYPNIWWSLSNEYDLTAGKSMDDWCEIETFVRDNDPYHHLLSNHNCFHYWDATRPAITHSSLQVKEVSLVAEELRKTRKPVMVDECCYEGNLNESWGSISGEEMTARFWKIVSRGGYCTHGETFLEDNADEDNAVVWWAKGGKLVGTSPERIAWLREIVESLPGPIDPAETGFINLRHMSSSAICSLPREQLSKFFVFNTAMSQMTPVEKQRQEMGEYIYAGHVADNAFLWYLDRQTSARYRICIPKEKKYKVEVLDTWNMTRKIFAEHASGDITVRLPGREYMAVLATEE